MNNLAANLLSENYHWTLSVVTQYPFIQKAVIFFLSKEASIFIHAFALYYYMHSLLFYILISFLLWKQQDTLGIIAVLNSILSANKISSNIYSKNQSLLEVSLMLKFFLQIEVFSDSSYFTSSIVFLLTKNARK